MNPNMPLRPTGDQAGIQLGNMGLHLVRRWLSGGRWATARLFRGPHGGAGRERVTLRAARLCVLTFACAAVGCALSSVSMAGPPAEAEAQVLAEWPKDFAAKRTAAVCGLFAPDTVLSYPGTTDRDFNAMCSHFGDLFKIRDKSFTYAPPQIEAVIVDGDTVVVRLVWTLTIADSTGKTLEVVREKGVDVFRRQPDGSWRIRISHAYPL